MATDKAELRSPDLTRTVAALNTAKGEYVRQYTKAATQDVADRAGELADENLERREGGGKYARSVARVFTEQGRDGPLVGLDTPWFGMEFGGNIVNVWGHRIGTKRQAKLGTPPMWGPHHSTSERGYIIGRVWSEQMDQASAANHVGNAGEKAITDALDEQGVPRG